MKVARVRRGPQPRLTSPFGVGGTLPQPALDDLSDVDTSGVSDGDTIVFDSGSSTWIPGTGGGSSLPWFVVTDYGAVNDGTTDDTTAINAAIAAFNAAGTGVLYFPAGDGYLVTGALTTITAEGLVMGDGMGAYDGSAYASAVLCDSQTAVLFTVTAEQLTFRDIGLFNVYSGNPSAGAGIQASGSFIGQKVDYDSIVVAGFYICIDVQVGAQWTMQNTWIWGPVLYGVKIRNSVNEDAGDWSISDSYFYADTHNATSAIRQESAGGGKLVNVKINGHAGATFTNGFEYASSSASTSVLTITGSSFENVSGDAIKVATTSTATFGLIVVTSCQFGIYSNNTGRIVNLNASASGAISKVILDSLVAYTDGTARAAISLTNTDRVTLGDIQLSGNYTSRYTSSGDTNTTDGVSVSFATPAIVLGTAAAAGAASTVIRSDSTIVAFDATVPVTQAFSDTAATGSAAFAARRDHKHGMPASPAVTGGVLLIADTHSTPIVFADIILNEATDDFLYSD